MIIVCATQHPMLSRRDSLFSECSESPILTFLTHQSINLIKHFPSYYYKKLLVMDEWYTYQRLFSCFVIVFHSMFNILFQFYIYHIQMIVLLNQVNWSEINRLETKQGCWMCVYFLRVSILYLFRRYSYWILERIIKI